MDVAETSRTHSSSVNAAWIEEYFWSRSVAEIAGSSSSLRHLVAPRIIINRATEKNRKLGRKFCFLSLPKKVRVYIISYLILTKISFY